MKNSVEHMDSVLDNIYREGGGSGNPNPEYRNGRSRISTEDFYKFFESCVLMIDVLYKKSEGFEAHSVISSLESSRSYTYTGDSAYVGIRNLEIIESLLCKLIDLPILTPKSIYAKSVINYRLELGI